MFQLLPDDSILRVADGAVIPADPDNTDFRAYLAWVDDGNEAEPVPQPPTPPAATAVDKLAALGLTVNELRELLGA